MKHRDTTESVEIRKGMFSSTIFEMELWTLSNDLQFSDVPALQVPDFIRDILEEGLQKVKTDI